jgi:hypothetical protein
MTMQEFKAWLDGYMEDRPGGPNPKEWEKIREKLNEVYPDPCHRDHWPYYPYVPLQPWWEPLPRPWYDGTGTTWKWNDDTQWIVTCEEASGDSINFPATTNEPTLITGTVYA